VAQVHLKDGVEDRVEQNWMVQVHLKGGVQDWVVLELLCMRHCSSSVSPHLGQGAFFALLFCFLAVVFSDRRCW